MHFKHSLKKHLAHSTTRTKTIHAGISAEYLELRAKLEKVTESIKTLRKQIDSTRSIYLQVSKHQHTFADKLFQALPEETAVRDHAREVESTLRGLQKKIVEDDDVGSSHKKIAGVLDAYLKVIDKVAEEYKDLETRYTEVQRYSKKVDKLNKKSKKQTTVTRNMDKLGSARAAYETKLKDVLREQHAAYDKHPAVFQCAHHAFWGAHDTLSTLISETTKAIRWESRTLSNRLTDIDVINTPALEPVPRAVALLPPTKTSDLGSRPLLPGDEEITPNPMVHVESEKSTREVKFALTSGSEQNSVETCEEDTEKKAPAEPQKTPPRAILAPEPPKIVPTAPVAIQTVQIPLDNLPEPPKGFEYTSAPVVQVTPQAKSKLPVAS